MYFTADDGDDQKNSRGVKTSPSAPVYFETQKSWNRTARNDKGLWSDTDYVRRLLDNYKIKASSTETDFTTRDALPNLALLAIKHHIEDGHPFWHWTVFQRIGTIKTVHDPAAYLETNERDDFPSMRPAWFIEIFT